MRYKSKKKKSEKRFDSQKDYDIIIKSNESFENYYKAQGIVDDDQWATFLDYLRKGLPASFRINSCCFGQTDKMKDLLTKEDFVKSSLEGFEMGKVLEQLCWDPLGLSFQLNVSRAEIRKSESLQALHNFLVSESENGYISRQETVSMIPPMVLDVKPHHKVLDACAAPGSKTAQIIEMLHANSQKSNNEIIGNERLGVVVANDIDNKRCYMLVHQAKRLHSPCFVITNHDSGFMPNFLKNKDEEKNLLKFDRILCDAPCSGDGTVRKNSDVWVKWNIAHGNNFHNIQTRIAKRCLELLEKDGLMVYSTCSMNPVEDEAVIASLLAKSKGGLELVDISNKLPGLKFSKGLRTWKIMQKNGTIVKHINEVDKEYKTQISESLFPPANIEDLNIDRCIRILPHLQNTGGFFVALIKKNVDHLAWEPISENKSDNESKSHKYPIAKKQRKNYGFKEDPFYFFDEDSLEWPLLKGFYKISDDFPYKQLMHRSPKAKRNIYFMSKSAKEMILNNEDNIKFINAGVKVFSKSDDKVCDCGYRIAQEGLSILYPYLDKNRLVQINKEELIKLLLEEKTENKSLREEVNEKLNSLPSGCCVIYYEEKIRHDPEDFLILPLCCWKGKSSVRPFVSKSERIHFLRMIGEETIALEQDERKRFKERQEKKLKRQEVREQKK